jgi:NSS family neurotransmitter:Na+ symporter
MDEKFKSNLGLILSVLGMAIGAGNIWRFPRLVGQYGGWFIILYIFFMVIWAVPLLMAEFSLGRHFQKGVVGAFVQAGGRPVAWMGAFVVVCSSAILFYYSVVTGWALKFFILTATSDIHSLQFDQYWYHFIHSGTTPVFYHFLSIGIVGLIILKGVVKGIEKVNLVILPFLFLLLIISAIFANTLPDASRGIGYLTDLSPTKLKDITIWMQALSQAAWSTGAGWGLVLTYAIYMKKEHNILKNSFYTIIGDGAGAILAALIVIPTMFALLPPDQALTELGKGNQGLSFIVLPGLFKNLSFGQFITPVFFLALFLAAISSMISMFEMLTRIFIDYGLPRKKATIVTMVLNFIFGIPSAMSMAFFNNQDWVWGLGLIIGGLFIGSIILKWGIPEFLQEVQISSKWEPYFRFVFQFLIPVFVVIMLAFWLYQSITFESTQWYNPFGTYTIGTTLVQWLIVLAILKYLNRRIGEIR